MQIFDKTKLGYYDVAFQIFLNKLLLETEYMYNGNFKNGDSGIYAQLTYNITSIHYAGIRYDILNATEKVTASMGVKLFNDSMILKLENQYNISAGENVFLGEFVISF